MLYTKKALVMLLASIVLGGGAWYLNTTGVLDGLSSSVFGPKFVCSEKNLKTQAREYRQKLVLQRRANTHRDTLEATIITLRDAGKTTEMQQQQKALRTLIRGIGSYNRFIKAYTACQKKIQNTPITTIPAETTALNSAPADGYDASRETGATSVSAPTVTPSVSTVPSVTPNATQAPIITTPVVVIPETTEAPETTDLPVTTDVPETTELPITTNIPETTEATSTTNATVETIEPSTTTEYIPETTQPVPATIPAEVTEAPAPSV